MKEERERILKKRWLILVFSCLINLCIGSLYTWSVFAEPVSLYLSQVSGNTIRVSDLSIVFTVANSIGPVTLISGGVINDKLGPRRVVFIGGILFGAGMVLAGFATTQMGLVIGYGLGCGLGMGLVYVCTVSNAVKFFPEKRGLVGGIATASYGISSVLLPPIANMLIDVYGVQNAFRILGIVFIFVICAGAMFMEKCPADFVLEDIQRTKVSGTVNSENKTWREMLKDPIFYIMICMMSCGAVFGLMTISQVSPIAQHMVGMNVASATVTVSIIALFNATGRVVAGMLSDIIGRSRILLIMLISAIAGLMVLYVTKEGEVVKFYIGISVIGLCFGAFMGVFPGFTADQFGSRNNSVNYGVMFIGFAVAGIVGPSIMSSLYKKNQSFKEAFLVALVLALLGIILNVMYQKMNAKKR